MAERYGYWTAEQAASVLLDDLDDGQQHPHFGTEDDEEDEPDDVDQEQGDGVAWRGRYVAVYVCTDHRAHGHRPWSGRNAEEDPPASEAEANARKEAAREQRKVTIDNNKAWRSAETVRRGFLGVLLGRKSPPRGAAAWVAAQLAHGSHDYSSAAAEGHKLACELFGVEPRQGYYTATPDGLLGLLDGMTDARAQLITLGLVLVAYEAATGVQSWRNPTRSTGAYLRFPRRPRLHPRDVERLAAGEAPSATTADDQEEPVGS